MDKINEKTLGKAAEDLSKLCNVDMDSKLQNVSGSVDEMLSRLEEYQTMLSFVSQDRIDYNDILTSIPNYGPEFDRMCQKIDTLDCLMTHMRSNLDKLEREIEKAEIELGCKETSAMTVTNILSPLFKKTAAKKMEYISELFRSEDYFKK